MSFNKFSQNQSTIALLALKANMQLGYSLQQAIKMQAESQTGKTGKLLKQVSYLINVKEQPVSEVLYKFGIITLREKYLIENSGNNAKKTIENILKMREFSGLFTKSLFSIIWLPLIAFPAGAFFILFILPKFQKPVNILLQVAQERGIPVSIKTGFWFIDNYQQLPAVIALYIILAVVLIAVYFYLRRYKPTVIFKIFPLAAYDDIPIILIYMKSLKELGISPLRIAEILEKSNHNPGWITLFKSLKKAIKESEPLWKQFYKFGFPKEISIFIRYAEEGKSFWENSDKMVEFAQTRAKDGNKMLVKVYGTIATYIGYGIIISLLMGIIMYTLQLQSVAVALQ